MIQKHISLPEELDQKIREQVKRLNQPEEQVITQLIEEGLKTPKQQWNNAGDALSSLSELGIRGPKDLAVNHDSISMMMSKPVILDSSALIAEINLSDSLYEKDKQSRVI
jgi:hypothetical protein